MGFRLVRIDTDEPCKMNLPVGTHCFGRGVFFDCDDRRISRIHGQLEVTADAVKLTSLHRNPCFYKKKGTQTIVMLDYNVAAELHSGDSFGLVPNTHWYEIIFCIAPPPSGQTPRVNGEPGLDCDHSDSCDDLKQLESARLELAIDFAMGQPERPGSLSMTYSQSTGLTSSQPNQAQPVAQDYQATQENHAQEVNQKDNRSQKVTQDNRAESEAGPSIKRSHPSAEQFDIKKVKIEPSDEPGTSYQSVPSCSTPAAPCPVKIKQESASPPPAPTPKLRERCWYGHQCYRKNPVHKQQLSHPHDLDWGAGVRAPCPYTPPCPKRDPRHWRDHEHAAADPGPPPPRLAAANFRQGMRLQQHGRMDLIDARLVYVWDESPRDYADTDDDNDDDDDDDDDVDYDYEF